MRQANLVAPRDIRIEEVEKPVVDENTVIVEIGSLGICGSNLHLWGGHGSANALMQFPMPGALGHEHAGVVAEVGRRVTRVKPGDRVAIDAFQSRSCGGCVYCLSGMTGQCENPHDFGIGGYADYLKLTEKGLYPLPANVKTEVAAVVEPFACSVSGIRRAGGAAGGTVVVLGAGVLGLCAAGAAKALGAEKVILTAKHDSQAALADRFNADAVVRSDADDLVERIMAETDGRGADLVVETVGGTAPTLSQALEVVRTGRTIVVLGLWDELVPVDSWRSVLKDVTYLFSLTYGVTDKKADFELCLEWMANGKVPAQDLVTHVRPFDDIQAAFELASDKTQGVVKVCLEP